MNTPILEIRNASLNLSDTEVLRNLNLSLCRGEILGIAGSNGAGKSSLLRIACGEQITKSGTVFIAGKDLTSIAPQHRARRMAVLPQSMSLQFDFTVRQVIALGRSPHGDLAANGETIVDQVLDQCQLSTLSTRNYQSLSGGEKQRTQFARVLAQLLLRETTNLDGQILILDEPTSSLDIRHQELFLAIIDTLRNQGCAVLLVMHDINLLARCADRLLFLKAGRSLSVGNTLDQLTEGALSELFDFPIKTSFHGSSALPFVYPDPNPHASKAI